MQAFETTHLPGERSAVAPDGSDVRILLGLKGGGMAHFELAPGQISKAVTHRTVEEIWYFIAGRGQMWRTQRVPSGTKQDIVDVFPGVCLTIPQGTKFQFRTSGEEPLAAIGVTMPPWPGPDEDIVVEGKLTPTIKE